MIVKGVRDTLEKKRLDYLKITALYNHCVTVAKTVASLQFDEAYDLLEASPYWKGAVKAGMRRTSTWWRNYWKMVKMAYEEKYAIFFDYNNMRYKEMSRDIEILYYSIKGILDKRHQKDSAIMARLITARELGELAAYLHVSFFDRMEEMTGLRNIRRGFNYAYNQRANDMLNDVMKALGIRYNGEEARTEDKNCDMAMKVIANRLSDFDRIRDTAEQTLRMNGLNEEEHMNEIEI